MGRRDGGETAQDVDVGANEEKDAGNVERGVRSVREIFSSTTSPVVGVRESVLSDGNVGDWISGFESLAGNTIGEGALRRYERLREGELGWLKVRDDDELLRPPPASFGVAFTLVGLVTIEASESENMGLMM